MSDSERSIELPEKLTRRDQTILTLIFWTKESEATPLRFTDKMVKAEGVRSSRRRTTEWSTFEREFDFRNRW